MKRLALVTCVMVGLGMTVLAARSAADATKYGGGVTLASATPIGDILARPAAYVGKTVRIEGRVTAVCEEMGCWMELEDAKTQASIRCKVQDGVIVFPVSAKGKRASAEGTIVRIESGASEHESAHQAPTPSKPVYQLRATGAVVYQE